MASEEQPKKIAFVGAGNMASAIIRGLLDTGFAPASIAAADPSAAARTALQSLNMTALYEQPQDAVANADLVILAVKPQIMSAVVNGLRDALSPGTTVMSIAAGIPLATLTHWINTPGIHVVRCMPNTPSLIRCGASALYADSSVGRRERHFAETTMAAVGTTLWVDEEAKMDAVTAVSGSGPAYFFAFMESMIENGERLGLSYEQAVTLTLQTALGAARLASEQAIPIDVLRRNVTSPGGTTERALLSFQTEGLSGVVGSAMDACYRRAQDMAKEFN